MQRIFLGYGVNVLMEGQPVKALMVPGIAGTVWKNNNDARRCGERAGQVHRILLLRMDVDADLQNLHRNIFFRDCAKVPAMPFFSALDSAHPEDLWKWMDGQRKAGNELLAISHNANLSDGRMYPTDVDSFKGRPIDAA